MGAAHSLPRAIRRPVEVLTLGNSLTIDLREGAVALNARLEDCIWLIILQLLMQLDRFLESISLFHNLPVLHRYHAIVHVCCQLGLLGLLLILKPGIACAKRIHLVALADLEAKSAHFVLHKLVM